MKSALVIGGTGPTGPFVVNGLIDRAYRVTVLHTGQHEADFKAPVEHIHTDPHFKETLDQALAGRTWDVAVISYGRLALAAEVLKGRTGRVIALGGATGSTASPRDPRWGPMGQPACVDEARTVLETDRSRSKFAYAMARAESALFDAHAAGHYSATYIGFAILYGPRQPAPHDWCIVRRVLDGRRRFVVADGGIKLESRAYVENAAHAVLLALDNPRASSGQKYFVADSSVYSMRQRVEAITSYMGHEFELVDMPFDLALPCHALWRHSRDHRLRDTRKIAVELGYRDQIGPEEALARTVTWLVNNRASVTNGETVLGDPFDYEREDRLIDLWLRARSTIPAVDYPLAAPAHMYRHPGAPNDPWQHPSKGKIT